MLRTCKNTLSVLLLISMLTALSCGEGVTEDTIADTAAGTTTAAPETAEYTVPDVDYNGAEFVILEKDPNQYGNWICQKYYSIYAEEEDGDPVNDAMYQVVRRTEEELNLDITYHMSQNRLNDLRTAVLAQDDVYDLAVTTSPGVISAEEGLAVDLGSIDALNLSTSWWQQSAVDTFTLNGQIRAVTGDMFLANMYSPIAFFYNKVVADEFKLGNLYDFVRSGDWTLDKCYEMCSTVATDLNGDSKMDENDLYGTALQSGLLSDLITASGIRYAVQNKDGSINFTLNTERTADVVSDGVTFLRDEAVNNNANLFTGSYKNVFAHLHIPMFKNNQLLFNFQQILIAFELRSMEADFGVLPVPKYDKEQAQYYTPYSSTWLEFASIPTTNLELDMAAHVLDSLGYYGQQYVRPAFIDTTVKDKSLRDEDSVEMLDMILENVVFDLGFVYDWGGIRNKVNNLSSKNTPDGFASMYASVESAVLAGIDSTLELIYGK